MDTYNDDTTISSNTNWKDVPVLHQALSQDLEKVENWFKANKMYIISTKTKAMFSVGKRLRKLFDQDRTNLQLSK